VTGSQHAVVCDVSEFWIDRLRPSFLNTLERGALEKVKIFKGEVVAGLGVEVMVTCRLSSQVFSSRSSSTRRMIQLVVLVKIS
jgi:hypothetical protein